MDLATAAAFTAAGLTLVNVRLTLRGQQTQWRRETERPIAAKVITLADQVVTSFGSAALDKELWMNAPAGGTSELRKQADAKWLAAEDLFRELKLVATELELLADESLRQSVKALFGHIESVRHWSRPPGGAQNPHGAYLDLQPEIQKARTKVIEAARQDIGVRTKVPGTRLARKISLRPKRKSLRD